MKLHKAIQIKDSQTFKIEVQDILEYANKV